MADTTGTSLPPQNRSKESSREQHDHLVEVKDADKVQAQLVGGFNWLEDNSKIVVALIAVAILGGLAYAAVTFVGNRQEKNAQVEYYKVEAPFMKKREAFEKAKFKAFMPAAQADDKTPSEAATGDLAKDYGGLLTGLESTAKEYAGTTAGGQAAILAAQTYLEYKQPEKAVEYAQLAAEKMSKTSTIATLGRVLWGNALSAKGDCQAALGAWQPILDNEATSYLHGDVAVRSGVCLEQLGQNDRAMEMYRKASATTESASSSTAKGLLRALEKTAAK